MSPKMAQIVVAVLFCHLTMAMLIPEDTEILDGFQPALVVQPDILPEDDYFEALSMSSGPLLNSVRNKRSITYDTKESNGLISHFRPNTVNSFNGNTKQLQNSNSEFSQPNEHSFRKLVKWLKNKFSDEDSDENDDIDDDSNDLEHYPIIVIPRRHRRDTQSTKLTNQPINDKLKHRSENIPNSMKHTNSANDYTLDKPVAAPLVGKFARSPFEYSKIQHEEDSLMDSSSLSMNDGIKTRTPRVNFVTQQKKSLDQDDAKGASTSKSDFYKTPPLLHNSKESSMTSSVTNNEKYQEKSSTARPPDSYSVYRDRDATANRYDE